MVAELDVLERNEGERALPLRPRAEGAGPLTFHHGAHAPYAIRWFGATSLLGHARHLVASAIASESIDSRDWMRPTRPKKLLGEVIRILGGDEGKRTLAEALGRPVWIDFVADTGDDHDVSAAVGRMLFATYKVDQDGTPRELPRGDLLVFGGDTAYPVATADELYKRLVAPWNRILGRPSGRSRVLIGIPGNHDWYDGLDGFARMFRRNVEPVTVADLQPVSRSQVRAKLRALLTSSKRSPSSLEATRRTAAALQGDLPPPAAPPPLASTPPPSLKKGRKRGRLAKFLHLDELGGIVNMAADAGHAVRAFLGGRTVGRRKRLALRGYQPVQEASYWALPLAPGLDAWGVDRQLGKLDFRQRSYFRSRREKAPDARVLFIAPEPAIVYDEPHEAGGRMLAGCRLSLDRHRVFYLTGDTHHYERRQVGRSLHVVAGGGGAFLHGTRIRPRAAGETEREGLGTSQVVYPSSAASRRLLAQVPLKQMIGGAGFIVHICFGLLAAIEIAMSFHEALWMAVSAAALSLLLTTAFYANAGHQRAHPRLVAAVAVPFGVGLGVLPMALEMAVPKFLSGTGADVAIIVTYAFVAAFVFGLFLATIAVVGLEHQQAFSVLGHPGYKHFVRLCIHPDGRVEGWTIGKDDPLGPGGAVLVDSFTWGGADPGPPLTVVPRSE